MTPSSALVYPASQEEICDLVRDTKGNTLLFPLGSDSRQVPRPESKRNPVSLSTAKVNSVVRLEAADFYITCQAGLALSELHDHLTPHNLRFPFLASNSPGTVGGLAASGQICSEGRYYNISRWVLAMRVVLGDGSLIKTGAITYKSVAGYDLPKLFCGSFGTLGIILEISLRLYPLEARPYGKDTESVAPRIPRLSDLSLSEQPASKSALIAQRIKRELDPWARFPVISGWNSR